MKILNERQTKNNALKIVDELAANCGFSKESAGYQMFYNIMVGGMNAVDAIEAAGMTIPPQPTVGLDFHAEGTSVVTSAELNPEGK